MTQAVSVAQYGSNNPTFRNRIINGAMGIWQRGTTTGSVSGTTAPYMVDRFYGYAGTGNITISRSTDVPSGFQYSCSMVGTGVSITQRVESVNCTDLGGATVTLSFWAKNSSGADNLQVSLYTATGGVDNWSSQTGTTNTVAASPSASWTYYTTTFTGIPATATNGVGIGIGRGSGGSSTTLITGVQLEAGTTATPFEFRQYGTELALCQRYYQVYNAGNQSFPTFVTYVPNGDTRGGLTFPVTMRATPTITFSTATWVCIGVGDVGAVVNVNPTVSVAGLTASGFGINVTNPSVFSPCSSSVASWGTNANPTYYANAEL